MTIPWDWEDPRLYEHLGPDTPGGQWLWEFVRRCPKYNAAWQTVLKGREDLAQILLKFDLEIEEYEKKELGCYTTNLLERARKVVCTESKILSYGIRGKSGELLLDDIPIEYEVARKLDLIINRRQLRYFVCPQIEYRNIPNDLQRDMFRRQSGPYWREKVGGRSLEEHIKNSQAILPGQLLWMFDADVDLEEQAKEAKDYLDKIIWAKKWIQKILDGNKVAVKEAELLLSNEPVSDWESIARESKHWAYNPTASNRKKSDRDYEGWRERLRIMDAKASPGNLKSKDIGKVLYPRKSKKKQTEDVDSQFKEAKKDAAGRIRSVLL
jgi:hypothetical protein